MTKIKKIEGYSDYFITDTGKVLSEKKGGFKWLKPAKNKNGYLTVALCKEGKGYTNYLHHLVAEAFIPNPEGKPFIDHINGIRTDNIAEENLRWCTNKENCNFPLARKNKSEAMKGKTLSEETCRKMSEAHKGEKHPFYGKHLSVEHRKKLSERKKGKPNLALSKTIAQYTKEGVLVATYPSASEAARQTGISNSNISACCRGDRNSTGGYIWKYAA